MDGFVGKDEEVANSWTTSLNRLFRKSLSKERITTSSFGREETYVLVSILICVKGHAEKLKIGQQTEWILNRNFALAKEIINDHEFSSNIKCNPFDWNMLIYSTISILCHFRMISNDPCIMLRINK